MFKRFTPTPQFGKNGAQQFGGRLPSPRLPSDGSGCPNEEREAKEAQAGDVLNIDSEANCALRSGRKGLGLVSESGWDPCQ